MDAIQKEILEQVAGLHEIPTGAYNIRSNGTSIGRNTTEHIEIVTKEDKSGIDVIIKPETKHESVHIPVILSEAGLEEVVYNDFHIGKGADVTIIAGCGIHNGGSADSKHDGIHRFFGGRRQSPLCRKALRQWGRQRKTDYESSDHCTHCKERLYGNGKRAD